MRNAVVTGVSRGLGRAIVDELLGSDWNVIAVSRSPTEPPAGTQLVAADIRDDVAGDAVKLALGNAPLDLLVNNAGVGAPIVPLVDAEPASLLDAFNTNVVGPFRLIQALTQNLFSANDPLIINVTSRLASLTAQVRGDFADIPSSYAYRISKAAQNMLTVSIANELGGRVRCWAVHPGALLTDMALADAGKTPETAARELRELVESPSTETLRFCALGSADLDW
jgi:NAD(P)-dependent dehydrogenase (short-subunit alcohol dehydrogenase family)